MFLVALAELTGNAGFASPLNARMLQLHHEMGIAPMLNNGAARISLNSIADALDNRAAAGQFFFQPLKTAIQMIHPVDDGFAFGCKTGNHQ